MKHCPLDPSNLRFNIMSKEVMWPCVLCWIYWALADYHMTVASDSLALHGLIACCFPFPSAPLLSLPLYLSLARAQSFKT